jgi:hypothetical protein
MMAMTREWLKAGHSFREIIPTRVAASLATVLFRLSPRFAAQNYFAAGGLALC